MLLEATTEQVTRPGLATMKEWSCESTLLVPLTVGLVTADGRLDSVAESEVSVEAGRGELAEGELAGGAEVRVRIGDDGVSEVCVEEGLLAAPPGAWGCG